jgi:hypothetical protein
VKNPKNASHAKDETKAITEIATDPKLPFAEQSAIAILLLMERLERDVRSELDKGEKVTVRKMLERRTKAFEELTRAIDKEVVRASKSAARKGARS